MGPNTNDKEVMRKLIQNGMDVARFNFSHGDHEEQKFRMDLLKELREEEHAHTAILLDTKGPEIRTGLLKDGKKVTLQEGNTFVLTMEDIVGDDTKVSLSYKGLAEDVQQGTVILIDDGLIGLKVKEIVDQDIVCEIVNGGELGERKGVNVPNVPVRLPAITEKDKEDIKFGVEQDIDFIVKETMRAAEIGKQYGYPIVSPSISRRIEFVYDIVKKSSDDKETMKELYNYFGGGDLAAESIPVAIGLFALGKGNVKLVNEYCVNFGGDCDTNAAMAGAMAGAYSGIEAVPVEWRETIKKVNGVDFEEFAKQIINLIPEWEC